jgi:hypothetical protein
MSGTGLSKMSKPWIHSKAHAKKYGGNPEDYIDIDQFMDSSKAHYSDWRHRCLLHNTFGCFIIEKVFGYVRTNSEGKEYSVRDVAEDHIKQDLGGIIPTVQDWLEEMQIRPWMGGKRSSRTHQTFELEPLGAEKTLDGNQSLPPQEGAVLTQEEIEGIMSKAGQARAQAEVNQRKRKHRKRNNFGNQLID